MEKAHDAHEFRMGIVNDLDELGRIARVRMQLHADEAAVQLGRSVQEMTYSLPHFIDMADHLRQQDDPLEDQAFRHIGSPDEDPLDTQVNVNREGVYSRAVE